MALSPMFDDEVLRGRALCWHCEAPAQVFAGGEFYCLGDAPDEGRSLRAPLVDGGTRQEFYDAMLAALRDDPEGEAAETAARCAVCGGFAEHAIKSWAWSPRVAFRAEFRCRHCAPPEVYVSFPPGSTAVDALALARSVWVRGRWVFTAWMLGICGVIWWDILVNDRRLGNALFGWLS